MKSCVHACIHLVDWRHSSNASAYIYVCVCVYIYIYILTYTHIYSYSRAQIQAHKYIHTHTHMFNTQGEQARSDGIVHNTRTHAHMSKTQGMIPEQVRSDGKCMGHSVADVHTHTHIYMSKTQGDDAGASQERWEVYGTLRSHLDCVRSVSVIGASCLLEYVYMYVCVCVHMRTCVSLSVCVCYKRFDFTWKDVPLHLTKKHI